jgi:hypothetical protein
MGSLVLETAFGETSLFLERFEERPDVEHGVLESKFEGINY